MFAAISNGDFLFLKESHLWLSEESSTIRALDEWRNIKLGPFLKKKNVFGI